MTRKAISPVVAVVILVALAVTVGGLLSSWITSFVYEGTAHDTCAITTTFIATDAEYNASSGQVKLKVKNTGREDLYNFTIEADNGTMIEIIEVLSPADTYHLTPGKSQYIITNGSSHNLTNIEKITVLVGSCPGYLTPPVNVVSI